jgi:DNA (cytosine-5)-methyltransferase 1
MEVSMKPTLVDLFCGIGVGALGFIKSGFEIAAALDLDPEACEIYRHNLKVTPFNTDIRKVSGRDILGQIGLRQGDVSVVVGCPPCQGFSSLRNTRRKYRQRDGRKSLLRIFGERIGEILPKTVVLENVRGLTDPRNRRFLREFVTELNSLGYSCVFDVLDAADYGVPQHRRRLVLIGVRKGTPSLPAPSHSNPAMLVDEMPSWRTVRNAIGDLHPLRAGEKSKKISLHQAPGHSEPVLRMIRKIPHDGGGRTSLPKKLWLPCHKKLLREERGGAGSVYGRMRWDSPAPTITTRSHAPSTGRFLHPSQDRAITLREAARLQSIPDDFDLWGSKGDVGRWIGNAMPRDLAEAIARRVASYVQ